MRYTIMVVDDDSANLDVLDMFLSCNIASEELIVLKANSGNEALKILDNQQCDLIISDLDMPDGDGYFLLDQINKSKIATPVIIWSGQMDVNLENLKEKGMCLFIPKMDFLQNEWPNVLEILLSNYK